LGFDRLLFKNSCDSVSVNKFIGRIGIPLPTLISLDLRWKNLVFKYVKDRLVFGPYKLNSGHLQAVFVWLNPT